MYDGNMLETGYPRNDLLSASNRDEIAIKLKQRLNIPLDKKTILYAPTWRDDEYYGNGKYKFKLKLDLELLKRELGLSLIHIQMCIRDRDLHLQEELQDNQ